MAVGACLLSTKMLKINMQVNFATINSLWTVLAGTEDPEWT